MLIDENTVVHHNFDRNGDRGNLPYDHLYLKKCLIPFSANGDYNEMIQNDIFITFFKHLLKMIVVNVKIQSQLVGQFLFPDMSLVIRYSCR